MKILFVGTGEFAVPVFKALSAAHNLEIVGVITQPDKPVGREQHVEGGPLKQYLESIDHSGYPVFQPDKLKTESQAILMQTDPELVVVAAYGQMIPDDMLAKPKYGALNLHGSLLPKLRGAVPVPLAILQGADESGVTIQQMVKALDAGPIYMQRSEPVLPTDTTESLKSRLAGIGAEMLLELIPQIAAGVALLRPQDESAATYCYERDIAKELAEIRFETPVALAERMVRAFYPWPVAWLSYTLPGQDTRRIKVYGARIYDEGPQVTPVSDGMEIVRVGKRLVLVLEGGCLELTDLQVESKARHPAKESLFLASRVVTAVE